ncbi:MAG: hypothetical protein AAFR38_00895 [Planctomycetota bacterium]
MTRAHRRAHALVWPILLPALAVLLWWSSGLRPTTPTQAPPPGAITGETAPAPSEPDTQAPPADPSP